MLKFLAIFLIFTLSPKKCSSMQVKCGVAHQGVGLIVGGEAIQPGDFPWLVALLRRMETGRSKFFCGAVLIAKNKVLTAAHCVRNKNAKQTISPRDVIVYLGGHDLNDPYQPGTLSVSPSQIIVHPHWNPYVTRFDADIAIILLETELSFTTNIVPICMLNVGQASEVSEGIIVGYGQSEDRTKIHETIPRKLRVPIKENEECFLEDFEFAKISSRRTFCAGPKNGTGACRGDSGSGLFVRIGKVFYLRGIISSSLFDGNGNCDVNNYALYTNVPLYLRWIDSPSDPTTLLETPRRQQTRPPLVETQKSCGVMGGSTGLIQGGQRSSAEAFPWTVAIFLKEDLDLYVHKAVGTLISNKHVVSLGNPIIYRNNTNALVPVDVNRLKTYFGIKNFRESFVSGVFIIDGAYKILLHPNIKPEVPRSADIAIIILQSPIFFTNLISPICLWNFSNDLQSIVGRTGYSVGWGINEAGTYSELKKFSAVKIQDQNICRQHFKEYLIGNNYFCTYGGGNTTPCEFDDPLYMKLNGKWFLRGLLNIYFFRVEDNKCSLTTPVLYEDVARYSDWIKSVIKSQI